jgi:hypothetical protein
MLSMYCTASMLPCGRYYYAPEGGYVGNPWVKFSYQYLYIYMAWFIHHLDLLEHHAYQFSQSFVRKCSRLGRTFLAKSWHVNVLYATKSKPSKFKYLRRTHNIKFWNLK